MKYLRKICFAPTFINRCLYFTQIFEIEDMLTTDTKVALDLSPTSFGGESPVAMLGFFLFWKQSVSNCVFL